MPSADHDRNNDLLVDAFRDAPCRDLDLTAVNTAKAVGPSELESFHKFIGEKLENGGSTMTAEEALQSFRAHQQDLQRLRHHLQKSEGDLLQTLGIYLTQCAVLHRSIDCLKPLSAITFFRFFPCSYQLSATMRS